VAIGRGKGGAPFAGKKEKGGSLSLATENGAGEGKTACGSCGVTSEEKRKKKRGVYP